MAATNNNLCLLCLPLPAIVTSSSASYRAGRSTVVTRLAKSPDDVVSASEGRSEVTVHGGVSAKQPSAPLVAGAAGLSTTAMPTLLEALADGSVPSAADSTGDICNIISEREASAVLACFPFFSEGTWIGKGEEGCARLFLTSCSFVDDVREA